MTARPPDFEPLAGSDPVPGDPDQIGALARRYGQTAYEIEQQAGSLRALSEGARAGWKGASGTVFASKAEDLATRILLARDRYEAAATALSRLVTPMADAQSRAYAAVWKAKAAADQMSATQPVIGSASPAPGSVARAQAVRYEGARQDLAIARGQFSDAVEDYTTAVNAAANSINSELAGDPMRDSWWDANFGWISHLFEYISIAIIVIAVLALILICPLFVGLALAEGLAAFLSATMIGLMVAQTVFDGTAMVTGKESWVAFAADIVALASCGFGKVAEAAVRFLAGNAEEIGTTVAASRAGRLMARSRKLPGVLFSLSRRSEAFGEVLRFLKMGDTLDAADKAAASAEDAVKAAVRTAGTSLSRNLLTMSDDIGDDLGKLDAIQKEVPGVLRIGIARGLAQGLAGVDGAIQWGSFGGGGYFTLHSILEGSS
jgi:uncharacterized protein YukE